MMDLSGFTSLMSGSTARAYMGIAKATLRGTLLRVQGDPVDIELSVPMIRVDEGDGH